MAKASADLPNLPHKWQFAHRFRRNAFGWRSDAPMHRIKEALAEIKLVAKKDSILAAEGAISLLGKLSPALQGVDSSSGAIGSAVNRAIETLVPFITSAAVTLAVRQRWMRKLWQALEEDEYPTSSLWGTTGASYALGPNWPPSGQMNCCLLLGASGVPAPPATGSSRAPQPAFRHYLRQAAIKSCWP